MGCFEIQVILEKGVLEQFPTFLGGFHDSTEYFPMI
jgi:hypothetical protein